MCYVDDLAIMAEDSSILSMVKKRCTQLLRAKALSEAGDYLGIRIIPESDNSITLLQQKYAEKLVEDLW